MKTLAIQFNHPVKGRMQLRKSASKVVKTLNFKSDRDFLVHINTKGLANGDWSAFLEWNHDNRSFLIQRHFRIIGEEINLLETN